MKTIEEARRYASKLSRDCKMDAGIEYNKLFKEYSVKLLPKPENRYGWELRCEVVKPTDPIWS